MWQELANIRLLPLPNLGTKSHQQECLWRQHPEQECLGLFWCGFGLLEAGSGVFPAFLTYVCQLQLQSSLNLMNVDQGLGRQLATSEGTETQESRDTCRLHAWLSNRTELGIHFSDSSSLTLYFPTLPLGLIVVLQLLSHVQLFATPWTAALQASLSFTISWSLPWALEEVEKRTFSWDQVAGWPCLEQDTTSPLC